MLPKQSNKSEYVVESRPQKRWHVSRSRKHADLRIFPNDIRRQIEYREFTT